MLIKVKRLAYERPYSFSPPPQEDAVINTTDVLSAVITDARGSGPFLRVLFRDGSEMTIVGTPDTLLTSDIPPEIDDLIREVRLIPAFDHTDKPGGGRHGVELLFLLTGNRGVVEMCVFTGWGLKPIKGSRIPSDVMTHHPCPARMNFHSPVLLSDANAIKEDACGLLEGCPCWCLTTFHEEHDRMFQVLLLEGSEGVWREMEKFYRSIPTHDVEH